MPASSSNAKLNALGHRRTVSSNLHASAASKVFNKMQPRPSHQVPPQRHRGLCGGKPMAQTLRASCFTKAGFTRILDPRTRGVGKTCMAMAATAGQGHVCGTYSCWLWDRVVQDWALGSECVQPFSGTRICMARITDPLGPWWWMKPGDFGSWL